MRENRLERALREEQERQAEKARQAKKKAEEERERKEAYEAGVRPAFDELLQTIASFIERMRQMGIEAKPHHLGKAKVKHNVGWLRKRVEWREVAIIKRGWTLQQGHPDQGYLRDYVPGLYLMEDGSLYYEGPNRFDRETADLSTFEGFLRYWSSDNLSIAFEEADHLEQAMAQFILAHSK